MERGKKRSEFGIGGEEMKKEVRSGEGGEGTEKSSQMFLSAANLHPNK